MRTEPEAQPQTAYLPEDADAMLARAVWTRKARLLRTVVELDEEEMSSMNSAAKNAFDVAVGTYAKDLLKEGERLDFGGRSLRRRAELTTTLVRDADRILRRGYSRPARSFPAMAAHLAVPMLAVVAGVVGTDLKSNSIAFVFLLLMIFLLSAYLYMKD